MRTFILLLMLSLILLGCRSTAIQRGIIQGINDRMGYRSYYTPPPRQNKLCFYSGGVLQCF